MKTSKGKIIYSTLISLDCLTSQKYVNFISVAVQACCQASLLYGYKKIFIVTFCTSRCLKVRSLGEWFDIWLTTSSAHQSFLMI